MQRPQVDHLQDFLAVGHGRGDRVLQVAGGGLADEQTLHLGREHDCDDAEEDPDADAAERVPP